MINWLKNLGKRRKKQKSTASFTIDNPMNDEYLLFDFKQYYDNSFGVNQTVVSNTFLSIDTTSNESNPVAFDNGNTIKVSDGTVKIKIKPIDVVNELETVPTPFSLLGLEAKIETLKLKESFIQNNYAKREVSALLERLQNRKKYAKHKTFFDGFQNTTDEKIDILLSKYDLVMKTSDIFIPEFPDEAINIMKKYTDKVVKICGKKPVYYVIAEPQLFKKAYEKRDPILLVQSPFGFYWQILGAWDKEMILLSEL